MHIILEVFLLGSMKMAVCAGGCAMQKKNPLVHEVPGLGMTIVCHQHYSAALTGHEVGLYFFFFVLEDGWF